MWGAEISASNERVVQDDTSSLGLGAAILQDAKVSEKPFANRALSNSQLKKKMLAIAFALRRFDQYVYGRDVLIESDHQPLEIILRKPPRGAKTTSMNGDGAASL